MLDEIMKAITDATYKDSGDKYEHSIVWRNDHLSILRGTIERAIKEHTEKDVERETEMARLSAKVYAYEAIIGNSNFAPMLHQQKDDVSALEEGSQEWK